MRPFDDDLPLDDEYGDVALLVAGAREWPSEEFARELDARVARRFAPVAPTAGRPPRRRRRLAWMAGPAVALVAAGVGAVVVINRSGGTGAGLNTASNGAARFSVHGAVSSPSRNSKLSANGNTGYGRSSYGALTTPAATAGGAAGTGSASGAARLSLTAGVPAAPVPSGGGGKQTQSAQISLTTPNEHVEQVSTEVFNVVSLEHGTVETARTTAATRSSGGGYASFRLSIPTSNLQDAMTQLSRLRYAAVSSRTDATQNVSGQYADDERQLADAKALRTSLLKQLQTAYTDSAIDSIKAQLKLDEQQISGDESVLHALQHRISYSIVTVQVNAGGPPVLPVARNSGFTIHRAGHDAVRVLVVSAGVALIALAALIPVGLVAALLMWLWVWLRQRRREHALDAVE